LVRTSSVRAARGIAILKGRIALRDRRATALVALQPAMTVVKDAILPGTILDELPRSARTSPRSWMA
jgi:hypothetical protein